MPQLTTNDYLTALRASDYLLALQVIDFIVDHYSMDDGDADILIELTTFELLHHGFTVDDFYHIKLIYFLINESLPPFSDQNSYKGMILCSAAMQVMVYVENDLVNFYKTPQSKNAKEISQWLSRTPENFDAKKNSEELRKKSQTIYMLGSDSQAKAREIRNITSYVLQCQKILPSYLEQLIKQPPKDNFAAERLGVVKSFYDSLMKKPICLDNVVTSVTEFISKIEQMSPELWEKKMLSKLTMTAPESLVSELFNKSANFFQVLTIGVIKAVIPGNLKGGNPSPPAP